MHEFGVFTCEVQVNHAPENAEGDKSAPIMQELLQGAKSNGSTPNLPLNLLLLVFMLAPSSSSAQRNIVLGSSLTTQGMNTSWLSPSGDFAFGFRPMDTNTSFYLLAVWFNKTVDKTVIWYAKNSTQRVPVEAPSGSLLELTSDGVLSLRDPAANRELWNSQATGAVYANMLDTGDFVLTSADGSITWDTFSNPADTILPNQVLLPGMELRSRLMATDYTDGRFLLNVQVDGNLVFYPVTAASGNQYSPYWSSDTFENASQLVFNATGEIYFALTNGTRIRFTSVETSRGSMADWYHRGTLDPDGVFRQYIYPKTAAASSRWNLGMWWTAVDLIPMNICDIVVTGVGSGTCGFNSYCRIDGKNRSQTAVDCLCPPHYSFIDPERKYKGCQADFQTPRCDLNEAAASHQFDLLSMIDVDWPLADYDHNYPIDEATCRKRCMVDCLCAVTVFHQDHCWKKKLPLSNGRAGNSVQRTLYLKVPTNSSQTQLNTGTSPKKRIRIYVIAGTSSLFGVGLFLFTFILWYKKYYGILPYQRGPWNTPRIESFLQKQGTPYPKRYTYPEVRRMTNYFAHKLGQGGFGAVYRGKLPDGREIAVKILKETKGDGEEFMNEVASISRTSHVNVVTLLGFCLQGSKRAIVYEYMTNGSLERYTFGSNSAEDNSALSWDRLFDIVLGIARGLEYLHRGCSTRIVHFDIKPQNILLDQDFCPKISDFGLAKLCKQMDSTISICGARGTIGYIAPEVFSRQYGAVSSKSDVYGYGMVVLEMVGARKQIDVFAEESKYFPHWIYENLDEFCSTTCDCEISSETTELVRKMTIVGLWCIQLTPTDRPSMSKVLETLESNGGDLQLLPKAS